MVLDRPVGGGTADSMDSRPAPAPKSTETTFLTPADKQWAGEVAGGPPRPVWAGEFADAVYGARLTRAGAGEGKPYCMFHYKFECRLNVYLTTPA